MKSKLPWNMTEWQGCENRHFCPVINSTRGGGPTSYFGRQIFQIAQSSGMCTLSYLFRHPLKYRKPSKKRFVPCSPTGPSLWMFWSTFNLSFKELPQVWFRKSLYYTFLNLNKLSPVPVFYSMRTWYNFICRAYSMHYTGVTHTTQLSLKINI